MNRRRIVGSITATLAAAVANAPAWAQDRGLGPFPLSVRHALGETDIPVRPARIVTLGWNGEDAVVALGILPVAMPRRALFERGIFPWVEERLAGETPVLLASDTDYEQILLLRPDLILGVFSGIDAKAYARLSRIAPTVIYRSGRWQADWREQMQMTGLALGMPDKAAALIGETNRVLHGLAARHPILRGRSFTFGTYNPGASGIGVYLPADPRIELLQELGLRPSAGVAALADARPGQRSASVSLETLDAIDADILIMWYGPGARAAAEAQPLFNRLGAVRRGSCVALETAADVWSTSALSVLSIPYGFPGFVSRLAAAAESTSTAGSKYGD